MEAALRVEDAAPAEVTVLLTDDGRMHGLNLHYRNIDGPTDVLSFAQRDHRPGAPRPTGPAAGPELLGDIVVSVDTALRQARARGATLDSELALLVVHGTLHLLGYDDATEEGAEAMRQREGAALAALAAGEPACQEDEQGPAPCA